MKTNRRNFLGMVGSGTVALSLGAVESVAASTLAEENSAASGEKKVVILLTHPNYGDSKANRALVEAVKDIRGVTVVHLYDAPFTIAAYRDLLAGAGTVVFQFPFYWASAPSQLKKWCDEIFIGLAEQIKGVKLLVATTTGSEYDAYRSGRRNLFTLDELLRPYQVLAHHSGMVWQTPFVLYGASLPTAAESITAGTATYKEIIKKLLVES
ncbi:MAG: NAD(P)H-dependent oxidoreductase [Tannerella sp.]|nr:NAD(P)H-dependent oxidoreductase [Tannerella sp.]